MFAIDHHDTVLIDQLEPPRPNPRPPSRLGRAERKRKRDHPLVGDFTRWGLIGILELVQDRAIRALHPASVKLGATVDCHAREHALILRIVVNRMAFSPPLIITDDEIKEMAHRTRMTLADTLTELSRCAKFPHSSH